MNCNGQTKRANGFTLVEMLIVIAIIAVLVGIAIPVFGGQLTRAQVATDAANMRAAKAVAVESYMAGDYVKPSGIASLSKEPYKSISDKWSLWYYDATAGTAIPDGVSLLTGEKGQVHDIEPYGQMDALTFKTIGKTQSHKGQYIAVAISEDGQTVLVGWTYHGINNYYIDWYEDAFDVNDLA